VAPSTPYGFNDRLAVEVPLFAALGGAPCLWIELHMKPWCVRNDAQNREHRELVEIDPFANRGKEKHHRDPYC
jgi:hypothetical protein